MYLCMEYVRSESIVEEILHELILKCKVNSAHRTNSPLSLT